MAANHHINGDTPLSLFPADYQQAREKFLHAAKQAGCWTTNWPIMAKGPRDSTLAIDVASWGSPSCTNWLMITSGLHGTEGPLGSAVQTAFLKHLAQSDDQDTGVLFIHALNPFGYAWIRRANENNVDLNRNFLLPGEPYQGAHPLYHHVYRTYDPLRPPRFYENFYLRAGWLIARHTHAALQTSLPVGQYEYPRGLFFGGHGPSETLELLQMHLGSLLPRNAAITHLDFHTGLGRWADYRLLTDVAADHPDSDWFRSWAPPQAVESTSAARTAYQARGSLGPWMKQVLFPHAHYRYAGAEFGTYRQVRVLRSLVKELQAHYSYDADHPRLRWAKRLVQETFTPGSRIWRARSLQRGVDLCRRCLFAMTNDAQRSSRGVSSVPERVY